MTAAEPDGDRSRDWPAIWRGEAWRAEATAWIEAELGRAAYRITGAIDQPRVRFWSTQLTVPTDRGRVWFKENNPAQSFEARLVDVLARLVPERVVTPIAIEPDRGWMLSQDQGATLREAATEGGDGWSRVLAEFGALQRELVPHRDDVLAAGLTRMSVAETPAYVERRLGKLASLPAENLRSVGVEEAAAARAALPALVEASRELAASGIPESLQHNDLHDGNAFAGQPGQPLTFFDFGDALWSHPLAVVSVPVMSMCASLKASDDDPRVARAVDAYVENWTDISPLRAVRALLPAAKRVAAVHRAVSWRRLLDDVPLAVVEPEWQDAESWYIRQA